MELNMKLLAFLITTKGVPYIEKAVEGSGMHPKNVVGVATFLLDIEGDLGLLTAKQQGIFERFLKPLLFDVPCKGSGGKGCRGAGVIEAEVLMKGYFHNDFRCRACRRD